jgi:hypothetical protein
MSDHVGVVGASPRLIDGRHILILPDDSVVPVDPNLTDEELTTRYELDRVMRAPKIECSEGLYVDGPMAGATVGYVLNRLRAISRFSMARGKLTGTYQVTELGDDDQPAELRVVEVDDRR